MADGKGTRVIPARSDRWQPGDWCCDLAARCRRHGYEVRHRSGCPGAEVDRFRARVAKLEAVAETAFAYWNTRHPGALLRLGDALTALDTLDAEPE